jgi:hypothetical protein
VKVPAIFPLFNAIGTQKCVINVFLTLSIISSPESVFSKFYLKGQCHEKSWCSKGKEHKLTLLPIPTLTRNSSQFFTKVRPQAKEIRPLPKHVAKTLFIQILL